MLLLIDEAVEQGIGDVKVVDFAYQLRSSHDQYHGVKTSPGVNSIEYASTDELSHTPKLTMVDGALFLRVVGNPPVHLIDEIEERIYERTQPVREIVRLHTRGLVIIDTTEETFILTEEEYNSQI